MKIKISEAKDITLTLGSYGLVRNNSLSFRFVKTDGIDGIVKDIEKLFLLNVEMSNILSLIIEDWLEPSRDHYSCEPSPGIPETRICEECGRVAYKDEPCVCENN